MHLVIRETRVVRRRVRSAPENSVCLRSARQRRREDDRLRTLRCAVGRRQTRRRPPGSASSRLPTLILTSNTNSSKSFSSGSSLEMRIRGMTSRPDLWYAMPTSAGSSPNAPKARVAILPEVDQGRCPSGQWERAVNPSRKLQWFESTPAHFPAGLAASPDQPVDSAGPVR